MVNKVYDIISIKNEYVEGVQAMLAQQFTIPNLEAAFVVLNDFCTKIKASSMILVRVEEEQVQVQRPAYPMQPPSMEISEEYNPKEWATQEAEEQRLFEEYKRTKAGEMNKKINTMNQGLKEEMPQMRSDINLNPEKPKTFTEQVKSYRPPQREVNDDIEDMDG